MNYWEKLKATQAEEERKITAEARTHLTNTTSLVNNPARAVFEESLTPEALAEGARKRWAKKRGVRELEW